MYEEYRIVKLSFHIPIILMLKVNAISHVLTGKIFKKYVLI